MNEEYATVFGGIGLFTFALLYLGDELQATILAGSFVLLMILLNVVSVERSDNDE
jgi:hypothetical protein